MTTQETPAQVTEMMFSRYDSALMQAVSRDKSRPVLHGIHLDRAREQLVATDGRILLRRPKIVSHWRIPESVKTSHHSDGITLKIPAGIKSRETRAYSYGSADSSFEVVDNGFPDSSQIKAEVDVPAPVAFRVDILEKMVKAAKMAGAQHITLGFCSGRWNPGKAYDQAVALSFDGESGITGLIMPVILEAGDAWKRETKQSNGLAR